MKINNFSQELIDVKITNGVFFEDERGSLKKSIHTNKINELMGSVSEVLCTRSYQNVIRGLHYQKKPTEISKFLTCVQGKILDVFVDIRKETKHYGKFGSQILTENDNKAIFIPKGFAHGFSTLSKSSTVVYLQSGDYDPITDAAINPLSLNIDWMVNNPIVSSKDFNAIKFEDL